MTDSIGNSSVSPESGALQQVQWNGTQLPEHLPDPHPNKPEGTQAEVERTKSDKTFKPPLRWIGLLGIGLVSLLYICGWLASIGRNREILHGSTSLANILYFVEAVLAISAVPLWFGATLFLTRKRRVRVGILWLILGVIILAPWPFFLNLIFGELLI